MTERNNATRNTQITETINRIGYSITESALLTLINPTNEPSKESNDISIICFHCCTERETTSKTWTITKCLQRNRKVDAYKGSHKCGMCIDQCHRNTPLKKQLISFSKHYLIPQTKCKMLVNHQHKVTNRYLVNVVLFGSIVMWFCYEDEQMTEQAF
eukprot:664504_1